MRSGTQSIIDHLKSQLKSQSLNYKDLAQIWSVSESSVKRIMSGSDLSLERVELVCGKLNISLGDFLKTTQFDQSTQTYHLSDEQELKLSKDKELLHFFLLLDEGFTPQDVMKNYVLGIDKATKFLVQLEKLNLIELLPFNKIKRKLSGQMRFKKNGPLARQLIFDMHNDFLKSDFLADNEHINFLLLHFIPGNLQQFKLKIQNLLREMIFASDQNRSHPNAEEFGILIASRHWPSPMLQALSRRKK